MSNTTRMIETLGLLESQLANVSEVERKGDYARMLVELIAVTNKRIEESKEMDYEKSFARCR